MLSDHHTKNQVRSISQLGFSPKYWAVYLNPESPFARKDMLNVSPTASSPAESERKHPISIRLDLELDLPWAGSLEHVAEPFRTLGNQLQEIRAGVRRGSAERAEPDDREEKMGGKLGDLAFKAFTGGLGVATLYLTVTFSINVYRGLAWHNAQSKIDKEEFQDQSR